MMTIGIEHTSDGWELNYAYNDGPACLAPYDERIVYRTKADAERARDEEIAATRAWNRVGLADAPHIDAY